MKKLFVIFFVLISSICFADQQILLYEDNDIKDDTTGVKWVDTTVAAGSELTWTLDLGPKNPRGFGALEITTSGSGTAEIVHRSSCSGRTYNTTIKDGSAMSDIVSTQSAGDYQYQLDMPFARYFQLSLTASGDTVTIDDIAVNIAKEK